MNDVEKMENKEFAFYCINELKKAGAMTDDVLRILTDSRICRDWFSFSSGFAILNEIPRDYSEEDIQKARCVGTRYRYYKEVITVGERNFLVTNHWYGPNKSLKDNRTPFYLWVSSKTQLS